MRNNYRYYLSLGVGIFALVFSLYLIYRNNGFSVFGYIAIVFLYMMQVLEANYFRNLVYKLEDVIEIQSHKLRSMMIDYSQDKGEGNESEQSKD